MPLPPLPLLVDATENEQKLYRYLERLVNGLEDFTPFQAGAAISLGGGGTTNPFNGITLPESPPIPDTPTGLEATGFFRQIAISWALDPNPFIIGWEVQRAENLAFTVNVETLTSARALMFVDEDLPDSTTRYYRIRALTEDPDNASSFTFPVSATTLANDSTVIAQIAAKATILQRAYIRNLIVDTAMIADASILHTKIGTAEVWNLNLKDGSVDHLKIGAEEVQTSNIKALAVTNAKINDVAADKLTAGTVNVLVQLTNQTIKLDGVNSQITIQDTQGSPVVRVKIGKLSTGASDYGLIVYNASGGVMWSSLDSGAQSLGIKDLAVITAKLNDLAATMAKLGDNAATANSATGTSAPGFNTTSGTYQNVTTVSITTNTIQSSPILVMGGGTWLNENTNSAAQKCTVAYCITRDTTVLREQGHSTPANLPAFDSMIFPGGFVLLDSGLSTNTTYTYKIQAKVVTSNTKITASAIDLVCLELRK